MHRPCSQTNRPCTVQQENADKHPLRKPILLAPGWTSLIRCVVGRFSYLPKAGHLLLVFSAWWGYSLTRPRLDTSRQRLARGGEILLLAPGWTSLVIVRRVIGRFSYSPWARHFLSSFSAQWGDSLTLWSSFGA